MANKSQKILIAGGAGYLGSRLVPHLLERGHAVDVIDLLWFGNHLPKSVRIVQKDIFTCTQDDVSGYDQVIFLAGLSNDPMADWDPAQNFISNAASPSYLSYLSHKSGVKRFIYAASCSVYGFTQNKLFDESSPAYSQYPYGISKLQGERGVLQQMTDDYSVIALRQGTISGYSPRMRFDLIINTMYKAALLNGRITINNPVIWRPILDIRDAVEGFTRAVEADSAVSGVFNLASNNYTVGEVGHTLATHLSNKLGKKISVIEKNIADVRNYQVSTQKAQRVLNYQPKYSLTDTVDSVHQHRNSYGNFDKESYYNINTFKNISYKPHEIQELVNE